MAFEELKQRQSVMWGSGPYQKVTETIADIHEMVVNRLEPQPGERWLDLAPVLLEQARARARDQGLEIEYQVGDCERLDGIKDASFDIVSSTCGIMFSPDHAASARQMARVLKRGGRLGLANWTPEGGLGKMFKMMAPFQPAPPPSSPFDWGKEDRVRELLSENFDLKFEKHISMFRTATGEEYWEIFSTNYGPTKTLADSLGPRREEFRRTWIDFFENNYRHGDEIAHDREWLLVLGTKR